MTFSEIEKICERDADGNFIRLKVPADEPSDDVAFMEPLDCIGRSFKDLKLDEVIRVKIYINKLASS